MGGGPAASHSKLHRASYIGSKWVPYRSEVVVWAYDTSGPSCSGLVEFDNAATGSAGAVSTQSAKEPNFCHYSLEHYPIVSCKVVKSAPPQERPEQGVHLLRFLRGQITQHCVLGDIPPLGGALSPDSNSTTLSDTTRPVSAMSGKRPQGSENRREILGGSPAVGQPPATAKVFRAAMAPCRSPRADN